MAGAWTHALDGTLSRMQLLESWIEMAYTINELEFLCGRGNWDEEHPVLGKTFLGMIHDKAVADQAYTGSVFDVATGDNDFGKRNQRPTSGPGPFTASGDKLHYRITRYRVEKSDALHQGIQWPTLATVLATADRSLPDLIYQFQFSCHRALRLLRSKRIDSGEPAATAWTIANSWWNHGLTEQDGLAPDSMNIVWPQDAWPHGAGELVIVVGNTPTGFYNPDAATAQLKDYDFKTHGDHPTGQPGQVSDYWLSDMRAEVEKMTGVIFVIFRESHGINFSSNYNGEFPAVWSGIVRDGRTLLSERKPTMQEAWDDMKTEYVFSSQGRSAGGYAQLMNQLSNSPPAGGDGFWSGGSSRIERALDGVFDPLHMFFKNVGNFVVRKLACSVEGPLSGDYIYPSYSAVFANGDAVTIPTDTRPGFVEQIDATSWPGGTTNGETVLAHQDDTSPDTPPMVSPPFTVQSAPISSNNRIGLGWLANSSPSTGAGVEEGFIHSEQSYELRDIGPALTWLS